MLAKVGKLQRNNRKNNKMCLINNNKQINKSKIMINRTSTPIKPLMPNNKYKEMQVFQISNEEKKFHHQTCQESIAQ